MKEHKEESSIQIKKNVRLLSTTNFLTGYLELNFLVRNRPNATTLSNEAFILHKEDEREKLMERYRYKEIERKRVRVLKNAVKRKKKCMRERERETNTRHNLLWIVTELQWNRCFNQFQKNLRKGKLLLHNYDSVKLS